MEIRDFIDNKYRELNFVIISKNVEKVQKTISDILAVFYIYPHPPLYGDYICIWKNKNLKLDIRVFDNILHAKGQRAPFVFIDKDIEITEEYVEDIILPINENHNNINSFTEGKGYFLI